MDNNPQYRNVGNLGDILKHAALVSLTKIAIRKAKKKLTYIDTHAFMLSAPCPNPDEWHRIIRSVFAAHESYQDYFMLERHIMENKPYRCSSGLTLDLLSTSGISYCAFLYEKDSQTRKTLKQQLHSEGQEHCEVISDALTIATLKLPPEIDTLLMLVDPFNKLDDELWNAVSKALCNYVNSGIEVIVQVFTYDKNSDAIQWREAPHPIGKPCAHISRQPFHLAVYSMKGLNKDVTQCCQALGWHINGNEL